MSDGALYRVGLVGATGAVGTTILEVLAERGFPASEVVPFSSERSSGTRLPYAGRKLECRPLSAEAIAGLDLVLSSAGGAGRAGGGPPLVGGGAGGGGKTRRRGVAGGGPPVGARGNPE